MAVAEARSSGFEMEVSSEKLAWKRLGFEWGCAWDETARAWNPKASAKNKLAKIRIAFCESRFMASSIYI